MFWCEMELHIKLHVFTLAFRWLEHSDLIACCLTNKLLKEAASNTHPCTLNLKNMRMTFLPTAKLLTYGDWIVLTKNKTTTPTKGRFMPDSLTRLEIDFRCGWMSLESHNFPACLTTLTITGMFN